MVRRDGPRLRRDDAGQGKRGAPPRLADAPFWGSRVTVRGHPRESTRYAMIYGIGTPWTSVSRMSRPLYRYVSFS